MNKVAKQTKKEPTSIIEVGFLGLILSSQIHAKLEFVGLFYMPQIFWSYTVSNISIRVF